MSLDLKYLRGKTYTELFNMRRRQILNQKTISDFNSVFVDLKTVEKIIEKGVRKDLAESDLITTINDDSGEINEFLFIEQDKFDSLLIYGVAGSGKSTIARKIEEFLWENFEKINLIPILIQLPQIANTTLDAINETLKNQHYNFDDRQINDLKQDAKEGKVRIVFILDSYDETKYVGTPIQRTNNLQSWGIDSSKDKNARVIITTRKEIFTDLQYRHWFYLTEETKLKEIEIIQFNENQRNQYLNQYVKLSLKRVILQCHKNNLKKNFTQNILDVQSQLWKEVEQLNINFDSKDILVDDHCQQKIQNLILQDQNILTFDRNQKEDLKIQLNNIWTQWKFNKLIIQLQLEHILITPFIMEIVCQVLPSMIDKQSDIIKVKKRFLKQFEQNKQKLMERNKIIIKNLKDQMKNNNIEFEIDQTKKLQEEDLILYDINTNTHDQRLSIIEELEKENTFLLQQNKKDVWNQLDQAQAFHNYSLANSGQYIEQRISKILSNKQNQLKSINDNYKILILRSLKKDQSKVYDFYKEFMDFYFKKEIKKLTMIAKNEINFETIYQDFKQFTIKLALNMTKETITVVNYQPLGQFEQSLKQIEENWQDRFFEENHSKIGKLKKYIKAGIPLKRKGNSYSFIHKSIQEFCVATDIIETLQNYSQLMYDQDKGDLVSLQKMLLQNDDKFQNIIESIENKRSFKDYLQDIFSYNDEESWQTINKQINLLVQALEKLQNSFLYTHNINTPFQNGIVNLIAEYVKSKPKIQQILIQLIQLTRIKNQFVIGGSNIITILNQADIQFRNQQFQRIVLQNARLNNTVFLGTNLSQSKLNNCQINQINLDYTDLTDADWKNCKSGELPELIYQSNVICFCLSNDGQQIIAGQIDGTITIKNIHSYEEIKKWKAHEGPVINICISNNQMKIVSCSKNQIIVQNNNGQQLLAQNDNEQHIRGICISTNEKRIFSFNKQNIKIWSLIDGQQLRVLEGVDKKSNDEILCLSTYENIIVFGCFGRIQLWNTESGYQLDLKYGHSLEPVMYVCISSDGKKIVSSQKFYIIIRQTCDGQILNILELQDVINKAIFSHDGNRIVSCGDKAIIFWNADDGQQLKILEAIYQRLISISYDGKLIVYGKYNEKLRIWNTNDDHQSRLEKGYNLRLKSVCMSNDGKTIVSGGKDQTIRIWNTEDGQQQQVLKGHTGSILGVCISSDGKRIISCSEDQTVRIWNMDYGNQENILNGHSGDVNSVCISVDGKMIVSGGGDSKIIIWKTNQDYKQSILLGHDGSVTKVCLSTDSKKIVSCGCDNTIRIWNTEDGSQLKVLNVGENQIGGVLISSDGKMISSCYGQVGKIYMYKINDGYKQTQLNGHTDRVWSLCISNDAKRIVSVSYDQTIRIWNTDTEKQVKILEHKCYEKNLFLSCDNKKIIANQKNKVIYFVFKNKDQEELSIEQTADDYYKYTFFQNQITAHKAKYNQGTKIINQYKNDLLPLLKQRNAENQQ